MQTPPRGNGAGGIAGMPGSPFLRLKQVDISAASDVEGVSARAQHSPPVARQPLVAAAHGAKEHGSTPT